MSGPPALARVLVPAAQVAAGATAALLLHGPTPARVGLGVLAAVVLLVAAVSGLRRRARERRERAPDGGRGAGGSRRGGLRMLLRFYAGYLPVNLAAGLGPGGTAVVLVGWLAAVLLVALLARVRRGRALSAARAAHPGAAVVLGGLVDLASVRLAQWAKDAGARVPLAVGEVVLVADGDGLAMERPTAARTTAGGARGLVHRWSWDEVGLSAGPHADGSTVLVLTLLGPPPAPRSRAVPVARRRHEVTVALRGATLAAVLLPPSSDAVRVVATGLRAGRDLTSPADHGG